jgi:hypothetical protein
VTIVFPSREFDEAVAAVCNGQFSDEQARALNELLKKDRLARDEYIVRVELHTRLASDPALFASVSEQGERPNVLPVSFGTRWIAWGLGLAACAALAAIIFWRSAPPPHVTQMAAKSRAVAMLNATIDARWGTGRDSVKNGAPIEPGWLRLESGLAQIVFYSGTRLVMQGPAALELISADEAFCKSGRIVADIPSQAHGFRLRTPQTTISDAAISVGVVVKEAGTELHVFHGNLGIGDASGQRLNLRKGSAALVERPGASQRIAANSAAFASLFEVQRKSLAAEAMRFEQWQAASREVNRDSSLLVHFDFGSLGATDWHVENLARSTAEPADAVIVGCQRGEGRWPAKASLEFQSVSDRVRLNVPGEFESLTLSAWISVKGLDRKVNSLLMSDGFQAGTVHWLIRNDGSPGLTAIGKTPGDFQIVMGPRALTLDKFGMWNHLAVVIDGAGKQVVHYVNGVPVSQTNLRIAPPFRIGAAELGNWNAKGFPEDDPFMIRNFSGAMDEFFLFSRALDANEVRDLYADGRPQSDASLR